MTKDAALAWILEHETDSNEQAAQALLALLDEEIEKSYQAGTASISSNRAGLSVTAARLLRVVPGVDAVYLYNGESLATVYVVAQEHRSVSWWTLIGIEAELQRGFGLVDVVLRAHQGRDPDSMFQKEWRLDLSEAKDPPE